MKLLIVFLTCLVVAECYHMFIGTSVLRTQVYHHDVQYSSKMLRKRVENLYFSLPRVPSYYGRAIQGILAFDKTHSSASTNVTQGGIGYNFVNLRMKSERGGKIHYDVYIYA